MFTYLYRTIILKDKKLIIFQIMIMYIYIYMYIVESYYISLNLTYAI